MVKGAVVEFTVPAMVKDVFGTELISEAEDTVGARLGGVEVIFGMFEGSELFDRKVFRELFDGEAGKIIRHSIRFLGAGCLPFISFIIAADCSSFMDW